MDKIKGVLDVVGHTPTVWLDDPAIERVCEENAEQIVLTKDAGGRVIGFELLHHRPVQAAAGLAGETVVVGRP